MILCFSVEDEYQQNIYATNVIFKIPRFTWDVGIHDPNFFSLLILNSQNPKSGPKNWIKPRSAVIIGSADLLKIWLRIQNAG